MITLRPLAAGDWQRYRDLRLDALRESPDAFASSYDEESARSEDHWATRISTAVSAPENRILLAYEGDDACALAWAKLAQPDLVGIYQMWVAPPARGKGVGHALLAELLAWARSAGARHARLEVTASNDPAMQLYTRHGFRPVGAMSPLRPGCTLQTQAMELALLPA